MMDAYTIRKLDIEDMPEASKLIWRSFYFAEKEYYTLAGMEKFRQLTDAPVLQYELLMGTTLFWGCYVDSLLSGVLALKKNHIVLLFVREGSQRAGIGTRLLQIACEECKEDFLTVNSAISAAGFYRRFGFEATGEKREEEGIRFIPMKAKKQSLIKALSL